LQPSLAVRTPQLIAPIALLLVIEKQFQNFQLAILHSELQYSGLRFSNHTDERWEPLFLQTSKH
jgi:hypothetical protein